jgi:hypothetical protein
VSQGSNLEWQAHDALRPPWETYAPPLPFGNQIVEF